VKNEQGGKRRIFVGIIIGLIIGIIVGISVLAPKIKTHAASKAVVNERDLKKASVATSVLKTLSKGDALNWRSAAPYPNNRPNIIRQAQAFSKQLLILSGEELVLPVQSSREKIEAEDLFGALAVGKIDALFTTSDLGIIREPALALYSSIPFGPKANDHLSWMIDGNGERRLQEILSSHNMHGLICGYLPPEPGGWYDAPLENLDQVKELRIRMEGLGAKVLTKMGASVLDITPQQVIGAFDQNRINAAIVSTPDLDAKSGLAEYVKNYYYPSWHSQGQPLLLLINAKSWRELNQERQLLLKTSCHEHTVRQLNQSPIKQLEGLSALTELGVTLHKFPAFILDSLKESWHEVLAEEARRNETFRHVWQDIKQYEKDRRTWNDIISLVNDPIYSP
jgi:TRAP-type mannitol/chloroaromatic compound transport system substrate-binding protein